MKQKDTLITITVGVKHLAVVCLLAVIGGCLYSGHVLTHIPMALIG